MADYIKHKLEFLLNLSNFIKSHFMFLQDPTMILDCFYPLFWTFDHTKIFKGTTNEKALQHAWRY